MRRRFSNQDKEKIKQLRALGKSYRYIAKELSCSTSTVYYHLNEKFRLTTIKKSVDWSRNHKELINERHRNWYQLHPERFLKSLCLSTLRTCLKRDYVSEQEILDTIKKIKERRNEV